MENISKFMIQKARERIHIYPPLVLVFNALRISSFDKVKVVIIG